MNVVDFQVECGLKTESTVAAGDKSDRFANQNAPPRVLDGTPGGEVAKLYEAGSGSGPEALPVAMSF